jgi:hypothetical protein
VLKLSFLLISFLLSSKLFFLLHKWLKFQILHEHQLDPELQPEQNPVGEASALIPLENRREAHLSTENEQALHHNFDIGPSFWLHFQDPVARTISGGDVTLLERSFMAGLQLPFPEIAQSLVLYVMIGSSQIILNAWRYLFVSFILWKNVLGTEMNISQFFNIYQPSMKDDRTVKLQVRQPPLFIWLKQGYSNNKF